jgi:hypothetical protein
MSSGDSIVERKRRRVEYLRWLGLVILGAGLMFLALRFNPPLSVDSIYIEYYGQSTLLVERNGHVRLSESGGNSLVVRRGLFEVDELYQQLLGKLVDTWDEEKRVDQAIGTVRIFFNNDTSGTYLIYDRDYLDELFAYAQANAADE